MHWILEPSNIRPATKKALRHCKALILLAFLAPRPGLEPGTYGLTGYRSICPGTRMNARLSGFALPIFLVRFTSGRPGNGGSEPLDIGSVDLMVPRRMMIAHSAVLRALPPRCNVLGTPKRRYRIRVRGLLCGAATPMRDDEREGRGALRWHGELDDDELGTTDRLSASMSACRLAESIGGSQQATHRRHSPIGIECRTADVGRPRDPLPALLPAR